MWNRTLVKLLLPLDHCMTDNEGGEVDTEGVVGLECSKPAEADATEDGHNLRFDTDPSCPRAPTQGTNWIPCHAGTKAGINAIPSPSS